MKIIRRAVIFCFALVVFSCLCQPGLAVGKINLNTATVAQLTELHGVGEKTALSIVEYRSQKKFASVDELLNVKGIGEKTLVKLRDQLTVEETQKK